MDSCSLYISHYWNFEHFVQHLPLDAGTHNAALPLWGWPFGDHPVEWNHAICPPLSGLFNYVLCPLRPSSFVCFLHLKKLSHSKANFLHLFVVGHSVYFNILVVINTAIIHIRVQMVYSILRCYNRTPDTRKCIKEKSYSACAYEAKSLMLPGHSRKVTADTRCRRTEQGTTLCPCNN